MSKGYDLLLLVADKRELYHLLKMSIKKSDRLYTLDIKNKKLAVFITGVGKQSIKRSLPKIKTLVAESKSVVNIGNAGAVKNHKFGDIIKVSKVIGSNGKEQFILDPTIDNVLVTVNSLQDKSRLAVQYPDADLVDMELFLIAKRIGRDNLAAYKIVLDTFKINPKKSRIKFILPILIRINSKKLTNFIKNTLVLTY